MMLRTVHISDCAMVTGLGNNIEETWSALLRGASAITQVQYFDTANYVSDVAATVPGLTAAGGESRLYPLLDQLLVQLDEVPTESCLITATTKGAIDLLEQHLRQQVDQAEGHQGGGQGNNHLPIAATPTAMTSWVARRLALNDGGININSACTSSTLAVARGAALIAHGGAEVVVVVCADLVSEFVFSGFSALQALSANSSRPFDRDRSGLTLGEGAVAIVLMSSAALQKYNRGSLATVSGWGAANDANHITAPARDGCGLKQTIRQTLQRAQMSADDVAAISAHGTGTVYNDMMELTAFKAVFGDRNIPFSSVKGALGHTLGAAGGIETILAIKSLASGIIPPTCGLVNGEELAGEQVSNQAQQFDGSTILSTNSGFGGVNAALLLRGDGGELGI